LSLKNSNNYITLQSFSLYEELKQEGHCIWTYSVNQAIIYCNPRISGVTYIPGDEVNNDSITAASFLIFKSISRKAYTSSTLNVTEVVFNNEWFDFSLKIPVGGYNTRT